LLSASWYAEIDHVRLSKLVVEKNLQIE